MALEAGQACFKRFERHGRTMATEEIVQRMNKRSQGMEAEIQQAQGCRRKAALFGQTARDKPQRESRRDVAHSSVSRWTLGMMTLAEGTEEAILDAVTHSTSFILVTTCRAAALDEVVNAGLGRG